MNSRKADKPTLVWDVDDVLNELMRRWLEYHRLSRSTVTLGYEQLSSNPPNELLQLSVPEYLASLDKFRARSYGTLAPRPEVVEWFRRNGRRAHHVALTAVPRQLADLSAAWVIGNFGDWIRTFAFVPSRRPDDPVELLHCRKQHYLSWMNQANVLIEDRQDLADEARRDGLDVVVIPQPWNSSPFHTMTEAMERLTAFLTAHGW